LAAFRLERRAGPWVLRWRARIVDIIHLGFVGHALPGAMFSFGLTIFVCDMHIAFFAIVNGNFIGGCYMHIAYDNEILATNE
jgi:hypothetical protein